MPPEQNAAYINLGFTLLIIVLAVVLRVRNVGRARPLKVERLWIVPALYALVVGAVLWGMPPQGIQWLWGGIALTVGAAVGWWRGTSIHLHVNPDTHGINQTSSWATVGLIAIFLLIRAAAKFEVEGNIRTSHLLIVLLVLFAFGLLSLMRLEMFLRARRTLRSHLAATLS